MRSSQCSCIIIGSNNQQSCTFQGFERELSSRQNSMSSTTSYFHLHTHDFHINEKPED
jgi:hypothetical protein